MSRSRRGTSPGSRRLSVRVKTARGRKSSSTRWLQRQLNDPYVADARKAGYRSRAAWKLTQLDDRFRFLLPGKRVVDLGAAPGGWTQVAVERVGAAGGGATGQVVAVDELELEPIEGAELMTLDMTDPDAAEKLMKRLRSLEVSIRRQRLTPEIAVTFTGFSAPAAFH